MLKTFIMLGLLPRSLCARGPRRSPKPSYGSYSLAGDNFTVGTGR